MDGTVRAAGGIVTKASPYPVAETLGRIEDAVREKGLKLSAGIDHSGGARRAGLEMLEAEVLIFGSPKAGTPLMVASPLLALDLPLKALVREDGEGGAHVSHNSTDDLASRHAIPEDLVGNIAGIDALIEGALKGRAHA